MDQKTIDWMIHRVEVSISRAKATSMELKEVLSGLKRLSEEGEG